MARNPLDQFIGLRSPKKRKPMEFEGLDFTEPEQPGTMELPEMDFSEPQDAAPATPTPEDRLRDPAYLAQYRKALEAKQRIDEGDREQDETSRNEAAQAGVVTRKPLDTSAAAFARQYFGRKPTEDDSAEVSTKSQTELGGEMDRAGPEYSSALRHFQNVPNVFLAARGMPTVPVEENPYLTERQRQREWLLKRGQLAEQKARTSAYTQSVEDARRRMEMRGAPVARELAPEQKNLLEKRAKTEEAKAEKLLRPPVAKPPKPEDAAKAAYTKTVDVGGLKFKRGRQAGEPETVLTKDIGDFQKVGQSWNSSITALDDLEDKMRKAAASPGIKTWNDLEGPALQAAGAQNAAIGQGVMSESEKRAMFSALGITGGEQLSDRLKAIFSSKDKTLAEDMVRRVRNAKELAKKQVHAAAKVHGFEPEDTGEKRGRSVLVRSAKTGRTFRLYPDAEPDRYAQALKAGAEVLSEEKP